MLRAVRQIGLEAGVSTHLSLETAMACGFGVCLGCAVPVYGEKPYRYCCTDGPVFDAREVRW
jgi:dihydroorotate dehydrogenase electron transfer subunit